MKTLARLAALSAWTAAVTFALSASADYEGASGYGTSTSTYEIEVSHDGYPQGGVEPNDQPAEATETPGYVVIEVEDGESREIDGETVIVVQEPEPVAVSESAPPPPLVVAVDQPVDRCPGGIWVDGYWSYANGQYVWFDGHCVVERVNYVFVHPRWDFYANVWWFVPGYYRPCAVWVGFGYGRPWYWFPPYYRPYYRGYRGVPVYRGAPMRPTVARPVPRAPARGVLPPRRLPTRAPTVARPVTRAPTVARAATRAPTVSRLPTRAPTVNRLPARAPTVNRLPTRSPTVARGPQTRAPTVDRPPATVNRVPTAGRSVGRVPTTTSVAPRSRPPLGTQPGGGPTRTGTVTRSPVVSTVPSSAPSRPGAPARANPVRRPGIGSPSRSGMFGGSGSSASRPSISRPSMSRPSMPSMSRPSMGARPSFGGRGGAVSRPSFGGFGGGRSVPTARGR